jgi:hypothetical protein
MLKVDPDFVKMLQDSDGNIVSETILEEHVRKFSPPRPWAEEKLSMFFNNLKKQLPMAVASDMEEI